MSNSECHLNNPDFPFSYCPSLAPAILFAVLFSLTTTGHVYQAVELRKPFALVLIMAGTWEFVGYAIRSAAIYAPLNTALYIAQMLLILLAPLWINAFVYMLIGRMIHFFLEDDRTFGVKARKLTLIFVVFDIIAFAIQGTGGSMSSSDAASTAKTGLNVYTGGVALQIFFNFIFLAIVVRFHGTAKSLPEASPLHCFRNCFHLLCLVYSIMGLIMFRNFYRLAEFASGLDNTIVRHEWYAYVFDAVPMLAAMVIFNLFHPGRKLQGSRCDFSDENQARKQEKTEKKVARQNYREGSESLKLPRMSINEETNEAIV